MLFDHLSRYIFSAGACFCFKFNFVFPIFLFWSPTFPVFLNLETFKVGEYFFLNGANLVGPGVKC